MLIATLLLLALTSGPSVKVYLAAEGDSQGFVDAELKRRQDSANDVARRLHGVEGIALTYRKGESDLEVLVVSSAMEATGTVSTESRPAPLRRGEDSVSRADTTPTVRLRLKFGDYVKEFVGVNTGAVPTWGNAAMDAARQVRTWVRDNQERICRESPRSCS